MADTTSAVTMTDIRVTAKPCTTRGGLGREDCGRLFCVNGQPSLIAASSQLNFRHPVKAPLNKNLF